MPDETDERRFRRPWRGHDQLRRDEAGIGDRLRESASDLRVAVRRLAASPGFTLAVVLSLALGIGANTAVFSLLDALLVRSLPVPQPERLVALGNTARTGSLSEGSLRADLFSVPLYRELDRRLRTAGVFTGLYASGHPGRLALGDGPAADEEPVRGRLVSGNFFAVLGVPAFLGRTLDPADDRTPGAAPYVVLSHDFWRRRFGADPAAVGRVLDLGGHPYTVVGVTPPEFFGDVVGSATDLWLPLSMADRVDPGRERLEGWDTSWLLLMGRLAPGASLERARTAVQEAFGDVVATAAGGAVPAAVLPERTDELRVEVTSGAGGFSYWRWRYGRPLALLMAIVALLLLVACANAANLLLERATGRRGELSVRLALGAGRGRLVRQLLTESLLLAGLAGGLGVALAYAGDAALLRLIGLPRSAALDPGPDPRLLAFTALVSLLTGVAFGLAPALQASRVELAPALRESGRRLAGAGRGGGRWPLRRVLVVAQVGVALLLLVGAGLFARTLVNLRRLDLGYPADRVLVARVEPGAAGYGGARLEAYVRAALAELGALPGASGVTYSENGLFSGTESGTSIEIGGRAAGPGGGEPVSFDRVGAGYFEVVGIPLALGRGIEAGDRAGDRTVAVVNEAFAQRFFPGESPLGRTFRETGGPPTPSYEIVGVARDARDHDLRGPVPPRFYAPAEAADLSAYHFELRAVDPEGLLDPVRATLRDLDPRVPVPDLAAVTANVADSIGEDRLVASLSAVFGLVALALAALGLYGVIAYAVSRRTAEIGVRMALGASRSRVLRMVLGETLGLTGAGVVLGLAAVAASTRLLASRLFGLSPHDPATVAAAVAALALVATVAGLLPAARATRVDPTEALRSE